MKKTTILLLLLILLILGCTPNETEEKDYKNDTLKVEELDEVLLSKLNFDYRDLELTSDELRVIKKYQEEEIYASTPLWPFYYHKVNVGNDVYTVGINHYLFEQLKQVFNLNIKVMEYEYFEDFINSLYNGETHFTGGIYYDDLRAQKGIYSDFYIKEQVFVYSKENLSIDETSDFNELVAGKLTESVFFTAFKQVLNDKNIHYSEKEYSTFEELIYAIDNDEVDFTVLPYNDELIKNGFKSTEITSMVSRQVGQTTKSHIYGRNNDSDLRILFNAFNKAIDYGIKENISLYQANYHNALLLNGDYFTNEEKEFIERTKDNPIILKLNSETYPYTYYNDYKNKWEGQALHIFDTISEITGMKYEVINQPDYSWYSILDELGKDGNTPTIDGTLGIAISDERQEYLDYTDSIYISKLVVVGKSTSEDILNLSDLYNYKVGTVQGNYTNELLLKSLPNIEVIDYEDTNKLVNAVKKGEIDYFVTFDSKFNKIYYDQGEYSLAIKHVTTKNLFFSNAFSKSNNDSELIVNIYNKILPLVNLSKINEEHFGNTVDLSKVIDKNEFISNVAAVISAALLILFIIAWYYMRRFKKQSLIDGLTGLKNRNALNELTKLSLYNKSVMFIDVDNFKAINNLYGHSAGDFTLKEISIKLSNLIDNGYIYRLGGDEFLIITNQLMDKDIEKIHNELNCVVFYEDSVINVHSTSAVLDCNNFKDLGFEDLSNLLSYTVRSGKRNGKNLMIKATDNYLDIYKTQKNLESKLNNAIKNKEFIPYFQPYINLKTQKVVGAEVLARWLHDGHIYSPAVFHELAEATGLIYDIDLFMFEENLKLLRKLKDKNLVSERFEVTSNFSPYTLGRLDVSYLEKLLDQYKLTKDHIGLEVTEQLLLDDKGFNKVRELQDKGFTIAIDDFSAGHSSLVYLLDLKIKYLKMDKSLLSKVNNDSNNENFIVYEAISKLANKLGIVVISEGVENKEQESVLVGLDIEFAQGYHYSKPINKEDFIKLVENDK